MPEVTIRLRINPETGKKDIIISMRGDEDALPHEHEQAHRAIADKVINGGLLKAEELGQIVVEREEDKKEAAPVSNTPQGERQAQAQGGK
jgi:hypothetical protein